jgi:hypothetical protein
LWERVPNFEYRAPTAAWVLGQQSMTLGILALWTLGAIAFAWRATARLGVD